MCTLGINIINFIVFYDTVPLPDACQSCLNGRLMFDNHALPKNTQTKVVMIIMISKLVHVDTHANVSIYPIYNLKFDSKSDDTIDFNSH